MDRSLYPEGVIVNKNDLERTELDRTFHIIQRNDDACSLGIVSGCGVSVNIIDNILIDIASGYGYAPNGELVEILSPSTALALANYNINVINYVLAIYTETNDELEPHETNGNSYPTAANRAYRIRILTETEYNSLPLSDDNFTNDALDRSMVLAKITAKGIGVGLTLSDIELPTIFNSAIVANNVSGNITGISIASIDRTTPTGIGYLDFVVSGSTIRWFAPGDAYGAFVSISTSGLHTITSSNGKTITLLVTTSSLPGTNQTDTIDISNIYTQDISRFSAEDLHHRSLLGSGVPTIHNPHGLTPDDLGITENDVEIHQDLFHANGILKTADSRTFTLSINTSGNDSVDVYVPATSYSFYINGIEHNSINSTNLSFDDVTAKQQAIYDIYLLEGINGVASLIKKRRAEFNLPSNEEDGGLNLLANNIQLRNISKSLAISANVSGTIRFLNADKSISFKLNSETTYGPREYMPVTFPGVLRLYNNTYTHYIDIYSNISSSLTVDETQTINLLTLPNPEELEARLLIGTVVYSGGNDIANTRWLGNGFGTGHPPNLLIDYGNLEFENKTNLISGVKVLHIERGTNVGSGTLKFTFAGSTLTWTAPNDTAGTPLAVAINGFYDVVSNNGRKIRVQTGTSLPGADATDTIIIRNNQIIFGTLDRENIRGDLDEYVRDIDESKRGVLDTLTSANYESLKKRLRASGYTVTIGTGYDDSYGDYNVKDFASAATCINQAIYDLSLVSPNGGGVIVVKQGTYYFNTADVININTPNITIKGENRNTTIFEKANVSSQILHVLSGNNNCDISNITFSVTTTALTALNGIVDIDGSRCFIEKCIFKINITPSGIFRFIDFSATYLKILHCEFEIDAAVTTNVTAITAGGQYSTIKNNRFISNTDLSLIVLNSSRSVFVENNIVSAGVAGSIITLGSSSDNHCISDNHINATGVAGVIGITISSGCTYSNISNNNIENCDIGIDVLSGRNIINDNMFDNCITSAIRTNSGMSYTNIDGNIVIGTSIGFDIIDGNYNIVNDNIFETCTVSAIKLSGAVNKMSVSGNVIRASNIGIDNSSTSGLIVMNDNIIDACTTASISLASTTNNSIVNSNIVMSSGVGISNNADYTSIGNNIVYSCTTHGITMEGVSYSSICNNIVDGGITTTAIGGGGSTVNTYCSIGGNVINSIGAAATAISIQGNRHAISNNTINVTKHGVYYLGYQAAINNNIIRSGDRGIYAEINDGIFLSSVISNNILNNQTPSVSQEGAITLYRSDVNGVFNSSISTNVLEVGNTYGIRVASIASLQSGSVTITGNSIYTGGTKDSIRIGNDLAGSGISVNSRIFNIIAASNICESTGGYGLLTDYTGTDVMLNDYIAANNVILSDHGGIDNLTSDNGVWGIVVGNSVKAGNADTSYRCISSNIAVCNHVEQYSQLLSGTLTGTGIVSAISVGNNVRQIATNGSSGTAIGISVYSPPDENVVCVGNKINYIGKTTMTTVYGISCIQNSLDNIIILGNSVGQNIANAATAIGVHIVDNIEATVALNGIDGAISVPTDASYSGATGAFPDIGLVDWGAGAGSPNDIRT